MGYDQLTNLATNRGNLLDDTACLEVSHRLHGFSRHVQKTEEIDLHLLPNLVLGERLEWAAQSVPEVAISGCVVIEQTKEE